MVSLWTGFCGLTHKDQLLLLFCWLRHYPSEHFLGHYFQQLDLIRFPDYPQTAYIYSLSPSYLGSNNDPMVYKRAENMLHTKLRKHEVIAGDSAFAFIRRWHPSLTGKRATTASGIFSAPFITRSDEESRRSRRAHHWDNQNHWGSTCGGPAPFAARHCLTFLCADCWVAVGACRPCSWWSALAARGGED